jgi:hypothetical protein
MAAAPTKQIVYFLELHFASGLQRFCTAGADMTYAAVNWQGIGRVLGIGQKVDKATLEATGWEVTLNGIPVELASLALQEPVQGRAWTLVVNEYDESGAFVATRYTDSGIMDFVEMQDDEVTL